MKTSTTYDFRGRGNGGGVALSKQIYAALIERIVSFELKPFEQISELTIAEEMGVSRTPIREALGRLSEQGLVDIFPQRGTVVSPLRLPDLEKSQFLREALETALLRRALETADRAVLVARLRAEIVVQSTFAELGDIDRFYAADEAFHGIIATAAGLASITGEIDRAKMHMNRFRHLMISGIESLGEVLKQHAAIVDAIEADDATACERAMQVHLRRILKFTDRAIAKFPEYFEGSGAIPRRGRSADRPIGSGGG